MSSFEDSVMATLRADADEAVRSTDTAAEWQALRDRLDAADRAITRRRWGGVAAIAAVAAAAVVLATLVVSRPTAEVPPAGPSISETAWTGGAELLGQPQLNLPTWAQGLTPVVSPRRLVSWRQAACGANPCPAGQDRSLTIFLPYVTPESRGPLTTAGTPDFLDVLRAKPGVQMSTFVQEATKNAGAANVAVVTTTEDVPASLGCPQLDASPGDCQGLVRGTRTVLAAVDAGGSPLLLWSTALSTTDAAGQDAEMRAVLATLRLTGIPVSCTGLLGTAVATDECLPDLWRRVERDASLQVGGGNVNQAAFDAAYAPYNEQLSDPIRGLQEAWSYERGPGLGNDGASTKNTTATWTIGTTTTVANVCFVGPQLIITTEPCP